METIIVKLVGEIVVQKKDGSYNVQVAGYSDKPSKLMWLQTWDMPFQTLKEAQDTLKEYKEKALPFIMMVNHKAKAKA